MGINTHTHTQGMSWTRCTVSLQLKSPDAFLFGAYDEIWKICLRRMETERARLALGSQNQAIQLSDGAHGFMWHEWLSHDCSLNLMFAEQGQRQIVLILLRHNNTRPFILQEMVTYFHSIQYNSMFASGMLLMLFKKTQPQNKK